MREQPVNVFLAAASTQRMLLSRIFRSLETGTKASPKETDGKARLLGRLCIWPRLPAMTFLVCRQNHVATVELRPAGLRMQHVVIRGRTAPGRFHRSDEHAGFVSRLVSERLLCQAELIGVLEFVAEDLTCVNASRTAGATCPAVTPTWWR